MRRGVMAVSGALALAALPAAILCGSDGSGAKSAPQPTDGRTPIVVTEGTRIFVLAEMRSMLAAAQGVAEAIGKRDPNAVAKAAMTSGLKAFQGMPKQVMMELPPDFRSLGMEAHKAFDQVAEAANAGAAPEVVSARLGEAMQFCVACHESFRFVGKP